MADAKIGALRVDLGLNTAQFTEGLKKAQSGLAQFGDAAKVGLGLVAAAAAAATVALGVAVKGAIDHADALSKAAQKAGVSVEALSRLEYAAKLSDVSLESLTSSLGKLSKGMADAAIDTQGKTASAFAALGISVTDAQGKIKSSTAVLGEIADKFASFPDGVTKSALAMQIFGKSGAELIPLLNSGSAGLAKMAAESDKVGATISTKTATAANKFNDTLTRIGEIMGGVVNKIMEAALPALQSLADLLASPQFAEAAKTIATVIINAMTSIISAVTQAVNWLSKMGGQLNTIAQISAMLASGNFIGAVQIWNTTQEIAKAQTISGGRGSAGMALGNPLKGGAGFGGGALGGGETTQEDTNTPHFRDLGKEAEESAKKANLLKDALKNIGPAGKTAADMASKSLRDLGDNAFGSLANLSGALSSLFKQNKAFAVATAVLQGLQGVAYALGSSAPPWNFINAAAVGIEAAANVANILATNENSTSMPSSGGGTAGQAAAAAVPQQGVTFNIHGSGVVGVDDIVNQIVQQAKDGGYSDLVQVMRVG